MEHIGGAVELYCLSLERGVKITNERKLIQVGQNIQLNYFDLSVVKEGSGRNNKWKESD
jgi:hypothetical protein